MVFENHYTSRRHQQHKQMAYLYKIHEAISRFKEKPSNPTSVYKGVADVLLLGRKATINTMG